MKLRGHLPEYLIEAFCLGAFMVAAGMATTVLESPQSWLHRVLGNADVRRALTGAAMGLTAVALIYSPWGRRSGAHMNPAVTLSFLRLGTISRSDAAAYVVMQFVGGLAGVLLVRALCGTAFTAPPVNWVATLPGPYGVVPALVAELLISAGMMGTVLISSASPRLGRYTGLFAGGLVMVYITFEAPLSGMNMNPARSFASAAPANLWNGFWIYLIAPPLGMLAATEWYRRTRRARPCAKLMHTPSAHCIHCGQSPGVDTRQTSAAPFIGSS